MDTQTMEFKAGSKTTRAGVQDQIQRLRLLIEEAALIENAAPPVSTPQRRYLLGEALVEAQILTQWQLDQALHYQAELAAQGQPLRLGEILVLLNLIQPHHLKAALAAQLESLFGTIRDPHYRRVGDYLVQCGLLTLAQLHQGLARQAELRQQGDLRLLGGVLVQMGYLQPEQLADALLQWHQDLNTELW